MCSTLLNFPNTLVYQRDKSKLKKDVGFIPSFRSLNDTNCVQCFMKVVLVAVYDKNVFSVLGPEGFLLSKVTFDSVKHCPAIYVFPVLLTIVLIVMGNL